MCESKASIWWKPVQWSQCNYEGMHSQLHMQSRYLTNVKESCCLSSEPSGLSEYHYQLTYLEFTAVLFSLACISDVIGAFIGVLMQHARHKWG